MFGHIYTTILCERKRSNKKLNNSKIKIIETIIIETTKPKAMQLYKCEYVHPRTGRLCIRRSFEPGRCHVHRKSPNWFPCKECGKQTRSKYETCNIHAMKHQKKEQYYRKKAKNTMQGTVEDQKYKLERKIPSWDKDFGWEILSL